MQVVINCIANPQGHSNGLVVTKPVQKLKRLYGSPIFFKFSIKVIMGIAQNSGLE